MTRKKSQPRKLEEKYFDGDSVVILLYIGLFSVATYGHSASIYKKGEHR